MSDDLSPEELAEAIALRAKGDACECGACEVQRSGEGREGE